MFFSRGGRLQYLTFSIDYDPRVLGKSFKVLSNASGRCACACNVNCKGTDANHRLCWQINWALIIVSPSYANLSRLITVNMATHSMIQLNIVDLLMNGCTLMHSNSTSPKPPLPHLPRFFPPENARCYRGRIVCGVLGCSSLLQRDIRDVRDIRLSTISDIFSPRNRF